MGLDIDCIVAVAAVKFGLGDLQVVVVATMMADHWGRGLWCQSLDGPVVHQAARKAGACPQAVSTTLTC